MGEPPTKPVGWLLNLHPSCIFTSRFTLGRGREGKKCYFAKNSTQRCFCPTLKRLPIFCSARTPRSYLCILLGAIVFLNLMINAWSKMLWMLWNRNFLMVQMNAKYLFNVSRQEQFLRLVRNALPRMLLSTSSAAKWNAVHASKYVMKST